jgi:hypothetical protein
LNTKNTKATKPGSEPHGETPQVRLVSLVSLVCPCDELHGHQRRAEAVAPHCWPPAADASNGGVWTFVPGQSSSYVMVHCVGLACEPVPGATFDAKGAGGVPEQDGVVFAQIVPVLDSD